jgi:hypothetical protein
MNKSFQSGLNQKGYTEISFTKVFIVLVMIVGGWAATHFFIGFYGNTLVEQTLTKSILKNRTELDDRRLADSMAEALKNDNEVVIDPEKIAIFRSTDPKKIAAEMTYPRHINIPLTGKVWDMFFTARVEEELK